MISEQEFKDWLTHPVTWAMKELLQKKREDMKTAWEGGSYTDWSKEGMALVNCTNIGTCKGYAFVQELEYDDFLTEVEGSDGGEQKRAAALGSGSAD